jgi:predicted ATPase
MARSPRSAHTLARQITTLADAGHHVIASVHNPILIASVAEVLSPEHDRWRSFLGFLDTRAQHPKKLAQANVE